MGQKINPIGFRLGINRTWDSRWFADNAEYGQLLHEDLKMRKFVMSRTMIEGIFKGVKDGFERKLEINGVGYRASLQGKNLQLALGFSHDVIYEPPVGITIAVPKPTEIVVSGINKQQVGQVAAEIREYRGPEPYKGKGVKYADERIVRKEGKKK